MNRRGWLAGAESAPEAVGMDVVGERLLPVDGHDGDPLPVAALELRVARDVDRLELERSLLAHAREDPCGRLAEVAAGRLVERDPVGRRYG